MFKLLSSMFGFKQKDIIFKDVTNNDKNEKEEVMAKNKKTVKFDYTDGERVFNRSNVFALRAPMQLTLRAGESKFVDFGVYCNCALLLFETNNLKKEGFRLLSDNIIDASTTVKVEVKNTGSDTIYFERGEVVLRAFVMSNEDLEVE